MEPIVIVKKRSRIWLIMIAVIIAMLLVAAALWFMGDGAATNITRISQTGTHASVNELELFSPATNHRGTEAQRNIR
jgi:flagellar basal body-associated protein FliL